VTRQKATRTLTSKSRAAERKAVDGWHDLTNAVDATVGRTRKAAKDARKRAKSVRREASARAGATKDALADNRPKRGRWLLTAAAAGLGLGAALGALFRRPATDPASGPVGAEPSGADDTAPAADGRANGFADLGVASSPVPLTSTSSMTPPPSGAEPLASPAAASAPSTLSASSTSSDSSTPSDSSTQSASSAPSPRKLKAMPTQTAHPEVSD
jgi:hypothetical protein